MHPGTLPGTVLRDARPQTVVPTGDSGGKGVGRPCSSSALLFIFLKFQVFFFARC